MFTEIAFMIDFVFKIQSRCPSCNNFPLVSGLCISKQRHQSYNDRTYSD
jgi:hypothetical protein